MQPSKGIDVKTSTLYRKPVFEGVLVPIVVPDIKIQTSLTVSGATRDHLLGGQKAYAGEPRNRIWNYLI